MKNKKWHLFKEIQNKLIEYNQLSNNNISKIFNSLNRDNKLSTFIKSSDIFNSIKNIDQNKLSTIIEFSDINDNFESSPREIVNKIKNINPNKLSTINDNSNINNDINNVINNNKKNIFNKTIGDPLFVINDIANINEIDCKLNDDRSINENMASLMSMEKIWFILLFNYK